MRIYYFHRNRFRMYYQGKKSRSIIKGTGKTLKRCSVYDEENDRTVCGWFLPYSYTKKFRGRDYFDKSRKIIKKTKDFRSFRFFHDF